MISGSRLLVMIFNFRKSTSGDIFWLSEVDFWWYILTSESRLSVIYFDFRKSTFDDIFWLSEVDFWWYILTFRKKSTFGNIFWLSMIYFDFRKSYILTSKNRHPKVFLGVWCPWISLNDQRVFWKFKEILEVQNKCLEV